jgi:hypothetical protein
MIVCSTVAVGSDKNTQTLVANVLGYNSVEHSTGEIDDRKIDFEISKEKEVLYVVPGAKDVNIMKITFKTYDDEMAVNGLSLKISGVDPENIDRAVLKSGEEILASGRIGDGIILFGNVKYRTDKTSAGELSVVIDVDKNSKVGDRIRLDIENSEDVYMIVGGKTFNLKNSFPLKGNPLSIVAIRSWMPGYTAPKNVVPVQ